MNDTNEYDLGAKEYDPETGCMPCSDVNEDGTVKPEAIERHWKIQNEYNERHRQK